MVQGEHPGAPQHGAGTGAGASFEQQQHHQPVDKRPPRRREEGSGTAAPGAELC